HHGQTLDITTFHQMHKLRKRHIFGCGAEGVLYHDLADLTTVLSHEVLGHFSGNPHQEFGPSDARTLRTDLTASHKISFRDHSNQVACLVNHGKAADALLQHKVCRIQNGRVG